MYFTAFSVMQIKLNSVAPHNMPMLHSTAKVQSIVFAKFFLPQNSWNPLMTTVTYRHII